jgi:phage tail-like protein
MMTNDSQMYFLLDSQQGRSAEDGWRVGHLDDHLQIDHLQITAQGLQLAPAPSSLVPLKDEAGMFGGLQYPTGVAIDRNGAIYIADRDQHLIYKVVRREGAKRRAYIFPIKNGVLAGDRFVYVPTVNRLERWARTIRTAPKDLTEVNILCETVWTLQQACRLVEALIDDPPSDWIQTTGCQSSTSASPQSKQVKPSQQKTSGTQQKLKVFETDWKEDSYPDSLPAGEVCKTTIEYLPCLGGLGQEPRQLSQPHGLDISAEGDLYVADTGNNRVQVFALQGLVLKAIWGMPAPSSVPAQGQPPPGIFNEPWDVVVDKEGNAYIADRGNHRVQKFNRRTQQFSEIDGTTLGAHFFQVLYEDFAEYELDLKSISTAKAFPVEGKKRLIAIARNAQNALHFCIFDHQGEKAVDLAEAVLELDKSARLETLKNLLQPYWDRNASSIPPTDKKHIIDAVAAITGYTDFAGDRFVFIPARQHLERWSHRLERDPLNPNEVKVLSATGVITLEEARQKVLEEIEEIKANGARDLLVEWEAAYPARLLNIPEPAFDKPTHLAIDRLGRLYVVDANKYVKVLNNQGWVVGQVSNTSDVIGNFQPTAVAIDAQGKLILSTRNGIHRFDLEAGGRYDGYCAPLSSHCTGMAVDGAGRLFTIQKPGTIAEVPKPKELEKEGTYYSRAINSDLYQCLWHRLVLDFSMPLPTGTSLSISTYTAEEELTAEKIQGLEKSTWQTGQVWRKEDWQIGQGNKKDCLILSPSGRYLWLKIELKGNGVDTPVLQRLKIYYPRQSYLQYLPAIYQADPVSKDFLDRFLSIFETIFSSIEDKIDRMPRYLDPDGVSPDFLPWLASWLDIAFDPNWTLETRRQLLRKAPELYRQRGTLNGLKQLLKLALGVDAQILEHFQLRRWIFLTQQSDLGGRSQLWGNSIVQRLQLDENSRIGDFALIGTGDPLRDPFHVYAHKFSVFVPADQCHSELVERRLRDLLDREKPAHTEYTLCKVEPRFRVGVQSTVGLDTQVGTYPQMVLNHSAILGYDTLLSSAPENQVSALPRVGSSTRVNNSRQQKTE